MALTACAAILGVACIMSVNAPLRFDRERSERETAVKRRLVQIRHAEERYRQKHGAYAADLRTLVNGGYLADSLQYVPHSGGQRFDIAVSIHTTPSGRTMPTMECGAEYSAYLKGLDGNAVANLTATAENAGRYPGLRIGNITTPNDNRGNWE